MTLYVDEGSKVKIDNKIDKKILISNVSSTSEDDDQLNKELPFNQITVNQVGCLLLDNAGTIFFLIITTFSDF